MAMNVIFEMGESKKNVSMAQTATLAEIVRAAVEWARWGDGALEVDDFGGHLVITHDSSDEAVVVIFDGANN